jgi:hypothetical protein
MIISYNIAMSKTMHITTIAELARSEGGVFTAAQAARLGVVTVHSAVKTGRPVSGTPNA